MFGQHKMTHDGTAKVVSCNTRMGSMRKVDSHGRASTKFDVMLDVSPEGASPFRIEVQEWFSEFRFPNPGDSLRVRCNPEKQAVEIDLSEDMRFNPKLFRRANEEKRKEEHARLLGAPPGTPATGGYGAVEDPELAELLHLETED